MAATIYKTHYEQLVARLVPLCGCHVEGVPQQECPIHDGLAAENVRLTERLGAALADKAKLSAENFQLRLQVREETAAANRAWSAAMEFNDARRAE